MAKTAFIDPAAVDAWDLWFRWREGTRLRDLTIDTTWDRVARAVARAENGEAATWAQRFADAFSKWQLLPDERLLREAGTGAPASPAAQAGPHAANLNATAFLRQSRGAAVRFDHEEFVRVCALAVRFLDDALLAAARAESGLQIGLFGVADALAALGVGYAGDAACRQAQAIARSFAEGCQRGDAALARERGANVVDGKRWGSRLRARGFDGELLADVRRYGMRHSRLTAIVAHPRLALFANNVADGLDPSVQAEPQARGAPSLRWRDAVLHRGDALLAQTAQLDLRAAVQPWIDRAIETPLLALRSLNDNERTHCAAHARNLGLKPPRWRLADAANPSVFAPAI